MPYVFGNATGCLSLGKIDIPLCKTANDIILNIPKNVDKADNFFRLDWKYENDLNFDGILTNYSNFNYLLNNSIIKHTEVHEWYWGTFDNLLPDNFVNDEGVLTPMPKVSASVESDWYNSGIITNGYNFSDRNTEGFYFSRLGGGRYKLPRMKGVTDNSLKRPIDVPFNKNFNNNSKAGWELNGGLSSDISIDNNIATIPAGKELKHSFFIFLIQPKVSLSKRSQSQIPVEN